MTIGSGNRASKSTRQELSPSLVQDSLLDFRYRKSWPGMSATLTVYSIASPRSCAIAAGAMRTLRQQARDQISVRMIGSLEQQTGGNHRYQYHADDQQPRAQVAHV